ncbi:hypothetical protein [Lonepinella sp. BR2904]|uniref:hypothetical protein n=1 Tax=Lonepinella sp. BR2904 TaxID=3434551 RepID=UPI003F6E270D
MKNIQIFAIGGAGFNFSQKLFEQLDPTTYQIAHLVKQKEKFDVPNRTVFWVNDDLSYDQQAVETLLADKQGVILLAGLGGQTGTTVTPTLAKLAKAHHLPVLAFVSLPFSFEGGKRIHFAKSTADELKNVCEQVFVLDNNKATTSTSLTAYQEKINDELLKLIQKIDFTHNPYQSVQGNDVWAC